MLALSPSVFSSFGWPLDEPIGHDQQLHIQTPIETTSDQSFLPQYHHLGYGDDSPNDKKIFHNASERDRRKKMNTLYSSLRSLLPASDQTKKLSIPNTISRALKYIPELQREVKDLLQLKEELISKNSTQEDLFESRKKLKRAHGKASSSISTSQLSEREVLVQICVTKSNQNSLSDVLVSLEEEDELALLNASGFQSIGEWVFYNLHLQGKGPECVDLVQLREKLLAYCDKSGEPCSP